MKFLERLHLKNAPWQGFFSVNTVYKDGEGATRWGWEQKGFLSPFKAWKFAKAQTQATGVKWTILYFHLWKWAKGRRVMIFMKDGSRMRGFK